MALDPETNQAVPNILIAIPGVAYNITPIVLGTFAAGTHLNITASAPGYITESREVVVSYDMSTNRQQVTFLLTKFLVRCSPEHEKVASFFFF